MQVQHTAVRHDKQSSYDVTAACYQNLKHFPDRKDNTDDVMFTELLAIKKESWQLAAPQQSSEVIFLTDQYR